MQAIAIGIVVLALAHISLAGNVRGYLKKNGTYVAPYTTMKPIKKVRR